MKALRPTVARFELPAAVAIAFGVTMLLDALGYVSPWVRANLVALFAFAFLIIPSFTLPRGGPGTDRYGLTMRGAARGVSAGLAVTLLTFAVFVPAHHIWATAVVGFEAHPDPGALVRPSDRYHGEPASVRPGDVHVFHLFDVWHVRWEPSEGPWRLEVESDATLRRPDHTLLRGPWVQSGEQPRPTAATFRTVGGTHLDVRAIEAGRTLPADRYRLGPGESTPREADLHSDGVRFRLGLGWLPLAALFQVLLIALPEEFFYRGYLQRRLDERHGSRRWGGRRVYLSRSNLIVSVLFALGHFVIGWDPSRLAVFFPSLLFGWLRDETDGIAAPVVFHAACNLMVQVVAVHYW